MPKFKLPEGEGAVKPDGRVPQILGDLGVKLQRLATDRVLERETLGVQPETTSGEGVAVQRVGVDRISDGREVDPDLVRPPGLDPRAEHRVSSGFREHLEVREGRLTDARGHERGIVGVTPDRGVDRPRSGKASPFYDRPVNAAHLPGRHHPDEPGVRRLALREHHQARCIAVEPVDDAWPGGVFSSPDAHVQERVYERARWVAGTGVHHEPRGLVHNQDVFVFEDYGDGDLLGRESFLGDLRLDALPAAHLERRSDRFTLDKQSIVLDQPPHEAPAHPEAPGGEPVEAFSGLGRVYIEASGRHPVTAGAWGGSRPYSRRRKKRLALKMRLSDCSPCSLSKNSCELLSSASDGSSCSTASAASGSVT